MAGTGVGDAPVNGGNSWSHGDQEVDICIVGAGVIGLTAASTLLQSDPDLTIILLDRNELCAGATGAGQGYIWVAHRDPQSPAWEMAARSKALIENRLISAPHSGDPFTTASVEWQPIGSMLLASSQTDADTLRARESSLRAVGIRTTFIDAATVRSLEPSVCIPDDGGALLTPRDSQLNGRRTAAAVLEACKAYGPHRFSAAFHEDVIGLSTDGKGRVCGVRTEYRKIIARRGVVLASGAWAGDFLAQELDDPHWKQAILPRRGLLLEMPRPDSMPVLTRGLMEMGYTKHYSDSGKAAAAEMATVMTCASSSSHTPSVSTPDITFAATTSASGTLLVGSSREFSGWSTATEIVLSEIIDAIMVRAVQYLPGLARVADKRCITVRQGLRPFAPGGGPFVGPVPGVDGLIIASGHEGSGLTLSEATAELIADYVLERSFSLSEAVVAALRCPCRAPRD